MPSQEFRTIVAIKAFDGEWYCLLTQNLIDLGFLFTIFV